jgi:hypothetical protein
MRRLLALSLLILAGGFVLAARAQEAPAPDSVLIETSLGGFADGEKILGPLLLPPEIQIYKSGRIIFLTDRGVWTGQVEKRRFEKLLRSLSRSPLLRATQVIPVQRGDLLGLHGGMAYFLYNGGPKQVIAAVLSSPRHGPWRRMLSLLRSCIPSTYKSFVPEAIDVSIRREGSWADPVPWPFQETLSLKNLDDEERKLSDPRMVNFVLRHLSRGFSWLEVPVSEDGVEYTLSLHSVPGWFEPGETETTLGFLAADAERSP